MGVKRIVVAEHERALVYRDRRLQRVLGPGQYWLLGLPGQLKVELHDVSVPLFRAEQAEILMQTAGRLLAEDLQAVETAVMELALIYRKQRLVAVQGPSSNRQYWKQPLPLQVERVSVTADFELSREQREAVDSVVDPELARALGGLVLSADVADQNVGLLVVDGELNRVLAPGRHAFWRVGRSLQVEHMDQRVQAMEVSGQEILTRDKVSLRLNLVAQYRVSDPVRARTVLQRPVEWMYRELQFALRLAVAARDLDKLLESKDAVDREVFQSVADKAAANGFELCSAGLRDVILPGDMREILNQVVQAEKAAQANVIKRREETAATRSLLNTAKLMDENPTLLRLKELETLEKVTDKVDRLTVFGGLDGVLKDTVRIQA